MSSSDPNTSRHIPVLGHDAVALLTPRDGGIYVDATCGAGGYSRMILDIPGTRVIGIDRDRTAIMGGFEPKLLPPSGALQAALQAWRDDPWIVHFAHCSKPWLARDRATRHHRSWWELAFATPFGPALARDFVEQLASR